MFFIFRRLLWGLHEEPPPPKKKKKTKKSLNPNTHQGLPDVELHEEAHCPGSPSVLRMKLSGFECFRVWVLGDPNP